MRPLKQKCACSVAKVLVDVFSLMGPRAILQSDNGHKLKNPEKMRNELLKMWPGLEMVNGKPMHNVWVLLGELIGL